MKTSALIIAATSSMSQQGGVGGKLTLQATVKLSGKLDVKKRAKGHLADVLPSYS